MVASWGGGGEGLAWAGKRMGALFMRNFIRLAQNAILIIGWIVRNAHTLRDFAGLGSEHFSVYGVGRTKRSPWPRMSILSSHPLRTPKLPLPVPRSAPPPPRPHPP